MIIFDLEWNSGCYDKIPLHEILQISAVKLERLGGRFTDTFNVFIRPTVHKDYAPPVKELPGLPLWERSELDFPAAIAAFAEWCGEESRFAAWGEMDYPVLLQNLKHWKVDFPIPERFYDLQAAFGHWVGAAQRMALYRAVEYRRIPDVFDYHDSMSDALYTALVCEGMGEELLAQSAAVPGQPAGRKGSSGLPKEKGPWTGPFENTEKMLNNRGCRLAACPRCGQALRVSQWYFREGGPYYARFSCPRHGAFLLRLTAGRSAAGSLWASKRVLEWTPENRRAWETAKGERNFSCRAKKRRAHWKRRRGRSGGKSREKTETP